jgi:UTP--glucose-1-phosphate uridylyltransferase
MLRKCLFPAAGYGTRFLPATKAMPKEMMPVVNKPLIQYGVEEAMNANLNHIGFISGRGKRAIEDHFDISFELEHQIAGTPKENLLADIRAVIDQCTFSYTRQKEMLGLGDAILTGENLIGDEPFAVLLADDLCINGDEGVLLQMAKLFRRFQCTIVAIEEVPDDQTQNYGIVSGDEIEKDLYRVDSMI